MRVFSLSVSCKQCVIAEISIESDVSAMREVIVATLVMLPHAVLSMSICTKTSKNRVLEKGIPLFAYVHYVLLIPHTDFVQPFIRKDRRSVQKQDNRSPCIIN